MTAGGIELAYSLSAKDRVRVQAYLDGQSRKREGSTLYFMTHPALAPFVNIFLAYICIDWLSGLLPRLLTEDLAEILRPSEITGHLFGAFMTWLLAHNIWLYASQYWGWQKAARAGREGVNWGVHRLRATAEALTIELEAHNRVYRWAAVTGIKKTKWMLLLMLTPRSAVAVPRCAFDSEAQEKAFCDFVQEQVAGAGPE